MHSLEINYNNNNNNYYFYFYYYYNKTFSVLLIIIIIIIAIYTLLELGRFLSTEVPVFHLLHFSITCGL